MDQEKVGKFISECRKEKGLTQADIAEKLGISNRAVSKWETGKSCPDASIMVELSDILGISVNELLCGEKTRMNGSIGISDENMSELYDKLKSYKRRLIINNTFLLFIAAVCLFTYPLAIVFLIKLIVRFIKKIKDK